MILKDQNERLEVTDLDDQELFFGQTIESLIPTLIELDLIEFDKSENAYFLTTEGYAIAETYEEQMRTDSNWIEEPVPQANPESIFDRRGFMAQVVTVLFLGLMILSRLTSRKKKNEFKIDKSTQDKINQLLDSLRKTQKSKNKNN